MAPCPAHILRLMLLQGSQICCGQSGEWLAIGGHGLLLRTKDPTDP
jgi:hypothetical protein